LCSDRVQTGTTTTSSTTLAIAHAGSVIRSRASSENLPVENGNVHESQKG
jgi:hypothetical protein